MTFDRHSLRSLLAVVCGSAAVAVSAASLAAVPVEESRASSSRQAAAAAPRLPEGSGADGSDSNGGAIDARGMSGDDGGSADVGRLSQLFYQLQVLQQELVERIRDHEIYHEAVFKDLLEEIKEEVEEEASSEPVQEEDEAEESPSRDIPSIGSLKGKE
ncbi:MAG: hypothetical protein R6V13_09415 [Anaerolineae bacterium]